ncbi:MAG: hypothetical protein LBW85_01905 [Deltaproteobacteria bacterium]|jgi:hypothetical protein|nr:hypothetical protein [Deltaproteobacteria bacterium]
MGKNCEAPVSCRHGNRGSSRGAAAAVALAALAPAASALAAGASAGEAGSVSLDPSFFTFAAGMAAILLLAIFAARRARRTPASSGPAAKAPPPAKAARAERGGLLPEKALYLPPWDFRAMPPDKERIRLSAEEAWDSGDYGAAAEAWDSLAKAAAAAGQEGGPFWLAVESRRLRARWLLKDRSAAVLKEALRIAKGLEEAGGSLDAETLFARETAGLLEGGLGGAGKPLIGLWRMEEDAARALGEGHPLAFSAARGRAELLRSAGRLSEAEDALKARLAAAAGLPEAAGAEAARTSRELGHILLEARRRGEAAERFREAALAAARALGEDSAAAAVLRQEYAGSLSWLGEWEEALRQQELAHESLKRAKGGKAAETRNAAARLAWIRKAAGRGGPPDEPFPY